DGIQGVIIRAGFGWDEPKQKDNMFESHYKNAKAAGLKIGAYHYSYATNKQQATREAYTFMDYIKGKEFDYPVFYDVEDAVQSKLSGDQIAEIMVTFGDILEGNGYYIGMYSYGLHNIILFYNILIMQQCGNIHLQVRLMAIRGILTKIIFMKIMHK
ncbi:MAG: GH25 family lysozyme, partial [Oscillospiraceae bacterium]